MTDVCDVKVHEAIKADRQKWKSLPYVGHQFFNGRPVEEVRNCSCKSTLYCSCSPEDEREILELIPMLMATIRMGMAISGPIMPIATIIEGLRAAGIVESHTHEALRRLNAEGKISLDPYYDSKGNRIYNRRAYAL